MSVSVLGDSFCEPIEIITKIAAIPAAAVCS